MARHPAFVDEEVVDMTDLAIGRDDMETVKLGDLVQHRASLFRSAKCKATASLSCHMWPRRLSSYATVLLGFDGTADCGGPIDSLIPNPYASSQVHDEAAAGRNRQPEHHRHQRDDLAAHARMLLRRDARADGESEDERGEEYVHLEPEHLAGVLLSRRRHQCRYAGEDQTDETRDEPRPRVAGDLR